MEHSDHLDMVVAELQRRAGELNRVARESGIPYDTVLRIKNRENDPGYSKVATLYRYLFAAQDTSRAGHESRPPKAA